MRAHFGQGYLPGQLLEGAQVRHQVFSFVVVRVGVGISRDLRDGIQCPFRGRVVAKYSVALAYLFQGANCVRLGPRSMPHLLAFYEKRVPVIVVRVGAEDPVMSLNSRCRHRGFESAAIYTLSW